MTEAKDQKGHIVVTAGLASLEVDGYTAYAFIARPAAGGPHPAVIVFHETFGVVEFIRKAAWRLAKEGFVGVALSLYGNDGPFYIGARDSWRQDLSEARKWLKLEVVDDRVLKRVDTTIKFLNQQEYVKTGAVAALGFSLGGGTALFCACRNMGFKAVVAYDGGIMSSKDKVSQELKEWSPASAYDNIQNLECPLLRMAGEDDYLLNLEHLELLKEKLIEHHKSFEIKLFPGAKHEFFNEDRADYHREVANTAWVESMRFLRKYL